MGHVKFTYFVWFLVLSVTACTPQTEFLNQGEQEGNTIAISTEDKPVSIAISEGEAAGTNVEVPQGTLSVGSNVVVDAVSDVPVEFQGKNISKASASVAIMAVDASGTEIDTVPQPMTIALPYQESGSFGLADSEDRTSKLCAMLKSKSGLFIWYRDDFESIDAVEKKAVFKSKVLGVFRLSYCESETEVVGFKKAKEEGLTGEIPEDEPEEDIDEKVEETLVDKTVEDETKVEEVVPVEEVTKDKIVQNDTQTDLAPISLSVSNYEVVENSGAISAQVFLNRVRDVDTIFTYQTVDGDALAAQHYTSSAGEGIIVAGQTSASISIPIINNNLVGGNHVFYLDVMSDASDTIEVSQSRSNILITEDDTYPNMSISGVEVSEGSGVASLTINLDKTYEETVYIDYNTINISAESAVDYVGMTGNLEFAPGTIQHTIEIQIINNETQDGDREFKVTLSGAINANVVSSDAIVKIIDDEGPPMLTMSHTAVSESSNEAVIYFNLSHTSETNISFQVDTHNLSAISSLDYTNVSMSVSISPGMSSQSITVPIINNEIFNEDKNFKVAISNEVGVTLSNYFHEVIIANDDAIPTLSIADTTVNENEGSVILTISSSILADVDVMVDWSTMDGTANSADYTSSSGTTTITAGELTATIEVPVINDMDLDFDETFYVNLTNPVVASIGNSQAVVTILNDDFPHVHIAYVQNSQVMYRRSVDGGVSFSEPVSISGASASTMHKVEMTKDKNGNPHLVYAAKVSPDTLASLYYIGSNDGGVTFSTPSLVENVDKPLVMHSADIHDINGQDYFIQVDQNLNVHIVYEQELTTSIEKEVFSTRSTDFGGSWSTPIPIGSAAGVDARALGFEVDRLQGYGYMHLLFSEGTNNTKVVSSYDNGFSWSAENSIGGMTKEAHLYVDDGALPNIAVSEYVSGYWNVKYYVSDDFGSNYYNEILGSINPVEQHHPKVSVDPFGNPAISYLEGPWGSMSLKTITYDVTNFREPIIAFAGIKDVHYFDFDFDSSSSDPFFLASVDESSLAQIYANKVTLSGASGAAGANVGIDDPNKAQAYVFRMDKDPHNHVHVVMEQEDTDGNYKVFYRRRSNTGFESPIRIDTTSEVGSEFARIVVH